MLIYLRDPNIRETFITQTVALDAAINVPAETIYQPDPTVDDPEGFHRLLQRRLDSDALLAILRTRYFVLNVCDVSH